MCDASVNAVPVDPSVKADLAGTLETMASALIPMTGYWSGYVDALRTAAELARGPAVPVQEESE